MGDITPVTTAGSHVWLLLMAAGVAFFVGAPALFVSVFFARTREDLLNSEELTMSEYEAVMDRLGHMLQRIYKLGSKLPAGRDLNA